MLDGAYGVTVPVAVLAGVASFFSPCILPLLPAYFSYATGLGVADFANEANGSFRGRMFLGATLFVAGFGVVFVALGVAAGSLGWFTWRNQDQITVALGVLQIVLGVVFLLQLSGPSSRFQVRGLPGVGIGFAPILGGLFAVIWLPCVGPTLGAILTIASTSGSPTTGGVLLAMYTLGFGIPFLAAAFAWHSALRGFRFVAAHRRAINVAAGLIMMGIGVMMLTGWWTYFAQWAQGLAVRLLY